ncbi:PilZ domain-containing protein [Pleionea mediterranea]|uniref:PilZ domain-containing protein n=1 Tax=Pleionea mediterranea TaxID=523701 RepID=A0A316FPR5_9GAMM|nr:PilZ domain-containing protein [Pleionea mediterranea]PWK50771.1 PilZ domain-containing protein [Pleionea mediterranea]
MENNELRKEHRVPKQESVYIEVLTSSSKNDKGLVVECSTDDISPSGIKVRSHYPITEGAFLELLIDFKQGSLKYLLTGEVKWCNQLNDEPTYNCGFELVDAEHSDIKLWRELFDN